MSDIRVEYEAVAEAVRVSLDTLRRQGGVLADLRRAEGNLEGTYFVRLFAVFEAALREFWGTTQKGSAGGQRSMILTRHLVASVAGRRDVPGKLRDAVQAVREYRNALTHGSDSLPEAISLRQAKQHLSTFLARLPETW